MRHLDEGTIHAWLDGALSAGESRDVEAHIATCGACAAMVAEARGFVAGASRILTGLDHVPGGVVPASEGAGSGSAARARETATASSAPSSAFASRASAPSRSPRLRRGEARWWTRSTMLRAAAVLLFLGGGTVVVLDRTGGADVRFVDIERRDARSARIEAAGAPASAVAESDRAAEAAAVPGRAGMTANEPVQLLEVPQASSSAAAPPPPSPSPARAVIADTGSRSGGADAGAGSPRARGETRSAAPQPRSLQGNVGGAGVRADTTGAARREREVLAGKAVAASVAIGTAGVGRASLPDTTALLRSRRDTANAAVAPDRFEAARRVTVTQPSTERALAPPAAGRAAAEEQRVRDSMGPIRLQENVVPSAAPLVSGIELTGCYVVQLTSWMPAGAQGARSPTLPPWLVLEQTFLAVPREGPRMVLRAPADSLTPTAHGSYWTLAGRDSLVLVWRAITPEITIRLGGAGRVRTGVAEQGGRRAGVTAERVGDACAAGDLEGREREGDGGR